jgi:flagellar hook protein FlgE
MGISSAMNAGVMGLSVNSSKLAAISDNIANSETIGYKRADVDFSSLVLTEQRSRYDAGGVRATPVRDVDLRGAIIGTTNGTDLAINGGGFYPVTDISDVDIAGTKPFKLVTTGSFEPDANGYLRTSNGFVLMGWQANPDGTVTIPNQDSAAGLSPIQIDNFSLAANPTTAVQVIANLPADETKFGVTPTPINQPIEYFNGIGGSETLTLTFTAQPPAVAGPATNAWELAFTDASSPANPIGLFNISFDGTVGGAGALSVVGPDGSPVPTAPPASYDPLTGDVTLQVASGPITVNIGALNTPSGLQQLAANYLPINITQNGAPASPLAGISITEQGMVDATFESGFRRTLYQVPIASVSNVNGLKALDGPAFEISRESGPVFFFEAGKGPTGTVISNALEQSNTDIADELTQLIRTQRAYSSNAKIIQTVDEMLQETTNLKR